MKLLASIYPDYYIETSVVSRSLPEVDGFSSNEYGFLNQVDIKKWRESRDWKDAYERNIRNALNYGLTVQINRNSEVDKPLQVVPLIPVILCHKINLQM